MSFCNDNEYTDIESLAGAFQSSSSTSQKRRICSVCNCTMDAGDECIICQQDRDYQNSLAIDSGVLLSFDFPPFPESSTPSVVSALINKMETNVFVYQHEVKSILRW